jgi:5-formyltetrahydrofolate cyclo-ligase
MVSTARTLPDVAALDISEAKQELRTYLRHARRQRPLRECAELAEELSETALEVVGGAECVSAYVSRPMEPGTGPLLAALHRNGVRVLLPVLGTALSREWAEYQGAADLSVRAPGRPPEPSGPSVGPDALEQADVVFTPALAVDSAGYRLGQGAGWYDRALAHVRPGALVICAIYDEEFVEGALPRDEHDVPVQAVITPTRWWRVT